MGNFGQVDGQREIPMDGDALREMLERGPGGAEIEHTAQPEIPPVPVMRPAKMAKKTLTEPTVDSPDVDPVDAEFAKKQAMEAQFILPSEADREKLKKRWGALKVVPLPYMTDDGRYKCFILRALSRSEWHAAEEAAAKIAEGKPISPQQILEEKIIARSVVWPALPETDMAFQPAGLISTLFGVAQQLACFFNPEAVMQLVFAL